MQGIDRFVDAPRGLRAGIGHELGHVLEREGDRVERLDDPVVEVAPDAIALIGDGEAARLGVEPCVVDRDPGMERERLHQPLIRGRELVRAALVGQVQVADRHAVRRDGYPEERGHRRVVRREARRVGMIGDRRDAV